MLRIIAFAGHGRAGKSIAAEYAAKWLYNAGYVPHPSSFAGPLKEAVHSLGATKADQPELYRKLCQCVGSRLRDRSFVPGVTGTDYWVDRMEFLYQQIDAMAGGDRLMVIDDLRYANEVKWVMSHGGLTVYLDAGRRLELNPKRRPSTGWRADPSEDLAWDYDGGYCDEMFDTALTNNGTLSELEISVRSRITAYLPSLPLKRETE